MFDKFIKFGESKVVAQGNKFNIVFNVESHLIIENEDNEIIEEFFQCEMCKAEHVFGKYPLFNNPSYSFTPVFGKNCGVVFRGSKSLINPEYRQKFYDDKMLGGYELKLRYTDRKEITFADAVRLSKEGMNLIALSTFYYRDGVTATIEYPIRTINASDRLNTVQVDTGPVVVPLYGNGNIKIVDSLRLAFVAFWEPHTVNFLSEGRDNNIVDYRTNYIREANNEIYV